MMKRKYRNMQKKQQLTETLRPTHHVKHLEVNACTQSPQN